GIASIALSECNNRNKMHYYSAFCVYLLKRDLIDRLFAYFLKLLKATKTDFLRYSYSEINWGSRMIGITGPRGVGKTTLILQYIKKHLNVNETLYVTAEDFYFADNKLVDLADTFVKQGGQHLFIE